MTPLKTVVALLFVVGALWTKSALGGVKTNKYTFSPYKTWYFDIFKRTFPELFEGPRTANCLVVPDPNQAQQVKGTVTFRQESRADPLYVSVDLEGFEVSADLGYLRGIHVHAYGNITGGCGGASTGGHYNPRNRNHGGPDSHRRRRHPGDFGNLEVKYDGTVSTTFSDSVANLFGRYSIIGRSIVVHAGEDDLGTEDNDGSRATGNAGPRLACCVIGFAANP